MTCWYISTISWHMRVPRIGRFLELIDRYGLKLQRKKCTLFAKALVWVGHHVSAAGVSVNPEFVRTLLDIPSPTTAADLQQFLAVANWIRGRIPEYATVVTPLQD